MGVGEDLGGGAGAWEGNDWRRINISNLFLRGRDEERGDVQVGCEARIHAKAS